MYSEPTRVSCFFCGDAAEGTLAVQDDLVNIALPIGWSYSGSIGWAFCSKASCLDRFRAFRNGNKPEISNKSSIELIGELADEKGWKVELIYGTDKAFGCTIRPGHWLAHMHGWVGQSPDPSTAVKLCCEAAIAHIARFVTRSDTKK